MNGQTEISFSSPGGAATVGRMRISPSPWDSGKEALKEWASHAPASTRHAVVKGRSWPLGRSFQLTTLLLVSAVAVAFVILRCHRQITAVNNPGNGPLRSLAEGEGAGRATLCGASEVHGSLLAAGASGAIELALLERAEGVVQRLIQVTKDCRSAAVLVPQSFSMKVVFLFLGFCIQEVAALSALLGVEFEEQKVEALQTAVQASKEVRFACFQQARKSQLQHASRMERYAQEFWGTDVENPPLAAEVRTQMLKELLELQELALELIEAAVASLLQSEHSGTQVTEEVTLHFVDEVTRVVYTRRDQVFKNKHLSHYLRIAEETRSRGKLVGPLKVKDLDERPEQSFEEQYEDLIKGKNWVGKPWNKTEGDLLEASLQTEVSPEEQSDSLGMDGASGEGAPARTRRARRARRGSVVPPRLKASSRSSGMGPSKTLKEETHGSPAKARTTEPAITHQAPTTASSRGQQLHELDIAVPALSPDVLLRGGTRPPPGPAASPFPAASLTVPAAAETLEAPWGRREATTQFGVTEQTPSTPWSSAWPPRLRVSPRPPAPDSASATAADVADAMEGLSLYQPTQPLDSQLWEVSSSVDAQLSSFLTTPQSISKAASEMLDSLRTQAPPMDMQGMARYRSGFSFYAPSSSIPPPNETDDS
ncbi:uncharacterized protein EMH_0075930 [Eimeria mitis]|uniref:Uncharacterized protein n=1 Tax=Eimeria mitis TaxID=44415 RepID=U6KE45_9EIME|nr:uncharacterized protein EMH_0075930 [Eimeria mitis]CDJ36295.1 hypothetical protein, conserved [Eimeria mitis]